MPGKINNEFGEVILDDHAIASIAASSAMECYGLVGMATKNTTDGIVELLKREHLTKGVKVNINENNLVIDLYIIVQYGTSIAVVATNIIERVKYSVENLTGMNVEKVNIYVQGVRVQK